MKTTRTLALFAGPLLALLVSTLLAAGGWSAQAQVAAAITTLCAVWWVFEPIPMPVTSLLPLALFPLFGVLTPNEVGQSYGNPMILLLLGGFILSQAMSHSGAHRRVALGMVNLIGGHNPKRLVFGFMLAAAVLSMWISNTATTLMLLPVALAALEGSTDKKLAACLLLSIAYAASVGGIGTPIGTPPNLIFMKVYQETTGTEPSFLDWMQVGVPVVICMLPIIAWVMTRKLKSDHVADIPVTGKWQTAERRVLILFACTAVAWVTRKEPFGGWSQWFGLPGANDAAVALIAVILLFLIPDGRGKKLLTWEAAAKIPWGVLLLFAGGIAIAKAFTATGLSGAIGNGLTGLTDLPPLLVLLIICLSVTFLTEVTSNTATTTLLMPILATAGTVVGVDPAVFMAPAAISASCAFMLPVATAPNAVMYGSGRVPIETMARKGLQLNLAGAVIIATLFWLTGGL